MSILDEVSAEVSREVGEMTPEQLKAEFAKLKDEREKRQAKQKEYNAKPESQEKRKAYSKEYREKNPEKFKEQRKAYMQKPEVKDRMKAYRTKRNAREKLILAKAKELGITGEPVDVQPTATQ